jgi:hypothetical protein
VLGVSGHGVSKVLADYVSCVQAAREPFVQLAAVVLQ